ncbi:MAG: type VI secretion system baseplate subunit TssF [Desulfovibrio sp.]|jgi:type VI secretion system protein ImpG|nr:type VI secretion system baseplate subunit TssF [Desulfovibrio sp.]
MDNTSYYQRELEHLRVLAAEFSRAHPAIAPLLSGPSSDPDVERLLEGAAFLTGQLTQKLDESYDRIAEDLSSLMLPQMLRDMPSCTILRFSPKASLSESIVVPKGSRAASSDVDGASCVFSTVYPVELAPMRLAGVHTDARLGKASGIRLDFSLSFPPAFAALKRLRLFFPGSRTESAQRLFFLLRHTERLVFQAGETQLTMPGSALSPVGFDAEEGLFPYPATAYPGFRLLQEYFVFPEKFFFVDIPLPLFKTAPKGVERFSCTFELRQSPSDDVPSFALDDFALFAAPAINLFPHETIPVKADQRQESYPIRANASNSEAYNPYQVVEVRGISAAASGERRYSPLLAASRDLSAPVWSVSQKQENKRQEMRLFLMYPIGAQIPEGEVLSLNVLYSNGNLPERLKSGDVHLPLSTSPALADFTNLTPPTSPIPAPGKGNVLWSMLAHLHLNYLPLADAQTLRALLSTYLPEKADFMYSGANKMRIESIISVNAKPLDYIWKGQPVRGSDILITLDESGFSNTGDLYFFGMVVSAFLQEYSAINSFVRVTVTDATGKYAFVWHKHKTEYSRR